MVRNYFNYFNFYSIYSIDQCSDGWNSSLTKRVKKTGLWVTPDVHEPATKVKQTILKSVQGSQSSNLILLFVPCCQNIGLPKTSIDQMIWKLEMLSHVWKLEMIYFRVGPGAVRQFTDAMAVRVENSENRGGHEPMTCLQWRTPGHQGLEQEENLVRGRIFQVFSVEKLQHVKQMTQYIQLIFQLVEQKDLGTSRLFYV